MLEADPAKYQRLVIEADLPFYDFVQARWDRGDVNMCGLVEYFPSLSAVLFPQLRTARANLNGYVVELARLWTQRNPFQLVNGESLPGIEEPALPDDLVAQFVEYVDVIESLEQDALRDSNRAVHCVK